MTTPAGLYDWIREIKPELKELDAIPLTGSAPPFPWSQLSSHLSKIFERDIKIEPGEIEWRTRKQLYEGLGNDPFPLNFSIPTIHGKACWVMPEQEMLILESLLLTKETHPISFQDRNLSESFYRFLTLEMLYALSQSEFDKTLIPILATQKDLPNEDSLCLDVSITIQQQTLWGRLIVSSDLRQSWVEHFAKKGLSQASQDMVKQVDVIAHLEAGYTQLTLKEWYTVSVGDLIVLDKCSLDPSDLNGKITLTLHGKKAFHAELQNGNIKIIEFPLYHEVETSMAKQQDEDEFDEFDTEDEDHTFSDTEFDEDFLTEEELEAPPLTTAPTESPASAPVQESMPLAIEKHAHIKLDEIPISLIVEVGRIQINIQKLLELEPGNLLELNVRPEDGVDLVMNGKRVGKGELIRIGESLGVRIVRLAEQNHNH